MDVLGQPNGLPGSPIRDSEIIRIVRMVFETFLGIPPEQERPFPSCFRSEPLVGCVQITGAWRGTVILEASESLAREFASAIFQVGPDKVDQEQIESSICELTNMVGGTLKSLLPEPCRLSIPAATFGTAETVSAPGSRLHNRVKILCAGETIMVSVLERY